MTETPYLEDPTVREFEATVERVVDDRVVLDRTHFYPSGGGQPADRGRLEAADGVGTGHVDGTAEDEGSGADVGSDDGVGTTVDVGTDDGGWAIVDVQKRDTIYHELDGAPPSAGTTVVGRLDWERRFAHMRYHTAQHLLSAVLLAEYDAVTTGNQLYQDRARIDVAYDRFTDDDLQAITDRVNGLVDAGLPVRWYEMDRERAEAGLDTERTRIDLLPDSITELRIVEIGSPEDPYDRTACAGTHVANTEAIGRFEATSRETKGSDEERLSFVLD